MKPVKKENTKPGLGMAIFAMASIFTGIFLAFYGIDQLKNYDQPFKFGFILSSIGLVLGLVFASLIKPTLKLDKRQLNQFGMFKTFVSMGFIGIMLATGSLANKKLSKLVECDKFMVVEKTVREDRFRSPGANFLIVDIHGKIQPLSCGIAYWNNTIAGQKIGLCLYESKIGFDFIEIKGDKK